MTTTLYTLRRYQVEDQGGARSVYALRSRGQLTIARTPQEAARLIRAIIR